LCLVRFHLRRLSEKEVRQPLSRDSASCAGGSWFSEACSHFEMHRLRETVSLQSMQICSLRIGIAYES
jgi:hypothetical protein